MCHSVGSAIVQRWVQRFDVLPALQVTGSFARLQARAWRYAFAYAVICTSECGRAAAGTCVHDAHGGAAYFGVVPLTG